MGQFRINLQGYGQTGGWGAMIFNYQMQKNVNYKVTSGNLQHSFTIDFSDYSRVKTRRLWKLLHPFLHSCKRNNRGQSKK